MKILQDSTILYIALDMTYTLLSIHSCILHRSVVCCLGIPDPDVEP